MSDQTTVMQEFNRQRVLVGQQAVLLAQNQEQNHTAKSVATLATLEAKVDSIFDYLRNQEAKRTNTYLDHRFLGYPFTIEIRGDEAFDGHALLWMRGCHKCDRMMRYTKTFNMAFPAAQARQLLTKENGGDILVCSESGIASRHHHVSEEAEERTIQSSVNRGILTQVDILDFEDHTFAIKATQYPVPSLLECIDEVIYLMETIGHTVNCLESMQVWPCSSLILEVVHLSKKWTAGHGEEDAAAARRRYRSASEMDKARLLELDGWYDIGDYKGLLGIA